MVAKIKYVMSVQIAIEVVIQLLTQELNVMFYVQEVVQLKRVRRMENV